ncbi:MAG: helix-turn-helix domain-containing protein [Actinobacteria bacterium]|nr:helix-turn-helix domain-containing protein [Actinomycetota bacterium]
MLVLNTDDLDAADRAEAFQASVSQNCSSSMVSFEDESTFRAELHVFELGPAKVFNIDASGNTLRRTPRLARAVNDCSIVLALPMRTTNYLARDRDERVFGPRDMILVDISAPYIYEWKGEGASYAFHVDLEQLGLPMDTVRAAVGTIHTSPLYPLVRDHIERVTAEAAQIAESPAAMHVGIASLALMQALIVSAADDAARLRDALHISLAARVQTYVHHHLRDVDLGPAKIAAANGISVRALYALYETLDVSLEQSIIQQRLDGARADLAAPRLRHRSIERIARDWGFVNPSFFSTRFRRAFGVSPRQWRARELAPDES